MKAIKLIKKLHSTEKSSILAEKNIYVFKVNQNVNKIELKSEIEKRFSVNIININILNTKPKKKRRGKITGKTKPFKKAYVRVKDGDKIELTEVK